MKSVKSSLTIRAWGRRGVNEHIKRPYLASSQGVLALALNRLALAQQYHSDLVSLDFRCLPGQQKVLMVCESKGASHSTGLFL